MAFPADKRIYFFSPEESEGDQSFRNTLGGKGANLAEMCVNRLFRRLLRGSAQPWLAEEERRGAGGGVGGRGRGRPGVVCGGPLGAPASPRTVPPLRAAPAHLHPHAPPSRSGLTSTARPLCRSKIGLPVPAGFTITCETCIEYQK